MFDSAFPFPLLSLSLPLCSHNSYKIYWLRAVPYHPPRFTCIFIALHALRARVYARGSGTKRIRARRREKVKLVSYARGRKYFRTRVDGIVCREARRGFSLFKISRTYGGNGIKGGNEWRKCFCGEEKG